MPRLRLLFFFCMVCVVARSQDSILIWKQQLEVAKSDSESLNLYSKLIRSTLDSKPVEAINYYFDCSVKVRSALTIDEEREDFRRYLIVIRNQHNQLRDSILKDRIASFKPGESLRSLAFYNLSIARYELYTGKIEKATYYVTQAGKMAEESDDPEMKLLVGFKIFHLYLLQGQFDKAKAELNKFNARPPTMSRKFYDWSINYCRLIYYDNLQNYDSTLYYAVQGRKLAPTNYHTAFCNGTAGIMSLQLGKIDDAISYLQQAKNFNRSLGNLVEYYRYICFQGDAFIRKGNYQQAVDSLLKVTREFSVEGGVAEYLDSYKLLSLAYSKLNEYKKAYDYHVRFVELYDSVNTQQSSKNIADMQAKYETERKDQEIALHKSQLGNQRLINYGMIGIAGLFLLVIGIIYRSYRLKQKSNRELAVAKERAEQSERFKQQFLANMSHEIRTPMNAVMGMTNLLIDKNPRSDQVTYLDGIQKSSGTLLHIINDILDVSKIEAGKIELERIDFSIHEVVEQVRQILQHKANENGIQLITDIDSNIPEVVIGDPVRLNQVLMNLSGNAIKFTEKGSVTIEVVQGKEGIRFTIIDTGIGIPKEKLQSVFESFTQAHSSDTRRFGGTGLGLTISKQLVELMGGRLSIESEPGSGSKFSFDIHYPLGSVERIQQQNSSDEIDGSILNGLKILLADDNDYNRIVARDTLKSKASVEIIEAVNGEDAIEKLCQNHFDVVLMDVQMPVMDGYEATRQIRNPQTSITNHNIPVIALTASVIRSDLDKCRQSGMTDYIPKPFVPAQLISTIAKATGRDTRFIKRNRVEQDNKTEANKGGIDLSYLDDFCEGDKERIGKYINIFLESSARLTEKLNIALKENSFEEIANQLHGFRTSWIMLGMDEAKELAVRIEYQCRKEKPDIASINEGTSKLITFVKDASIELNQKNANI